MLLSVIVPVYRSAHYISRCARSLFDQTLSDIEYIFVDDCSPDESISVLKSVIEDYPSRKEHVTIITHKYNKGAAIARNTGLIHATGSYIAFVDSDDWIDPQMYSQLLEKAEESCAEIVYCNIQMVFADHSYTCPSVDPIPDRTAFLKKYMMNGWTSSVNMVVRRSLYSTHSVYFPHNFNYCEDFHFTVRLFYYADHIAKIDKVFYYYNRTNENSLLHVKGNNAEYDERLCYGDLIRFFSEKGMIDHFKVELYWKILATKQNMALDTDRFSDFRNVFPETSPYIFSCPFLNPKIKLIMWFLAHHLAAFARIIVKFRNLKSKLHE